MEDFLDDVEDGQLSDIAAVIAERKEQRADDEDFLIPPEAPHRLGGRPPSVRKTGETLLDEAAVLLAEAGFSAEASRVAELSEKDLTRLESWAMLVNSKAQWRSDKVFDAIANIRIWIFQQGEKHDGADS